MTRKCSKQHEMVLAAAIPIYMDLWNTEAKRSLDIEPRSNTAIVYDAVEAAQVLVESVLALDFD